MFCSKCGKVNPEGSRFCAGCGSLLTVEMPQGENLNMTESAPTGENLNMSGTATSGEFVSSVLNLFGKVFTDKLFLALCILVTASVALPVLTALSGGTISIPVLNLLATIFMWLIYSSAKKGTIDVKNMRCLSGCVYAMKVLYYVISGIFAFGGAMLVLVGAFIDDLGEIIGDFGMLEESVDEFRDIFNEGVSEFLLPEIGKIAILSIGIGLIIAAVLIFLISKLCISPIHKFTKSSYESAMDNSLHIECAPAAKTRCLVLGILAGVAALSTLGIGAAFLSNAAASAVYIVAYVLIGKYLEHPEI